MCYNGVSTFVASSGKVIHFARRREPHTAGSVYHSNEGKNFWPLANLLVERQSGELPVRYAYPAMQTTGTYVQRGNVIEFEGEEYVGNANYPIWSVTFHELPKLREIRLVLQAEDGRKFFVTQTKYRPEWACLGHRDWRLYVTKAPELPRQIPIKWGEENLNIETTTIITDELGTLYVSPFWDRRNPDSQPCALLTKGKAKTPLWMVDSTNYFVVETGRKTLITELPKGYPATG